MLVSAVLQEIIDEAILDLTTAQMLVYFKSGLRQMSTLLKYRGFLTTGELSVAAAAQSASLTTLTGFIFERSVWYLSSGVRIPIVAPQSTQYFDSIRSTNGGGKPNYYKIVGTNIEFEIPLDEPVTVGLEYFKEISNVVLGDTFLGDERVVQAAKHMCLSRYYRLYEEDKQKSDDEKADGVTVLTIIEEDYEAADQAGNVECKELDGF